MSSNKKYLSILVVLFLAIAAASWFYFTKQAGEENIAETEAHELLRDAHQEPDTTEAEDANEGAHAHDHGAAAQTGTIHKLSIKPILGRRGVGDPNAPVKIHEFFSLTCNHCADFHTGTYQAIKERLIDTGKVYFIFEEFPLNGPALYGSMISRCLPEERYAGFIDLLFRTQEKWAFGGDFKGALQQNAKLAGMSDEEFETCFNNKDLQKEIGQNIKEASDAWKISSTPSFVLNDGARVLSGAQSIESFEKTVNELMGNDASAEEVNSSPLETSKAQKEIWSGMEAGTYDSKTFEPSEEAIKELKEKATDAVDAVNQEIKTVQ